MRNPFHISGWTFIEKMRLSRLPKDIQEKLRNKGDKFTIKLKDRYHLYVNLGYVTASTNETLIYFHRRWRSSNKTGEEK